MLAAKLREATTEDAQELYELALSSIKNVHTNDYEQKVLLEEFSKENIKTWLEEESIKVFVATYMGFIIGCCVYRDHFFYNLLISENYQDQGLGASLWGFARDNALVRGDTQKLNGEVVHLYAQEIVDKWPVTKKGEYELQTVLELPEATKSEVKDSKESLRRWRKKSRYYFAAHALNLFVLLFFFTGAYRYIFYPNEALTRLAYKITAETDVNWGKAAEKENYSEWKVDFLLWRGAKPYYTVGTDECYGAASIAMLWLQPKLLNHLTENIKRR